MATHEEGTFQLTSRDAACVDSEPGQDVVPNLRAATPADAPLILALTLAAHRGRGVATALMAWCERLAVDRGLREVRPGVRLGLPRNEALYRRLGYRPTGPLEEREGYGPIARWMAKPVGDGAG